MARTLLGRGRYFTAAYHVDGLLVDSGCTRTVPELLKATRGTHIDTIVNTHSHEDHVSGNAAITQRDQCRVLAHPQAVPIIRDPRLAGPLHAYRKIMWGTPEPSHAEEIGETVETKGHRLEVLHTPGHSPDHVCLFDPERGWLFSGDLFIGGKDKGCRLSCNIRELLEQNRRIAELDVEWIFPGSGSVRRRPAAEIRSRIAYLEDTAGTIMELHRRGFGVSRIRKIVFPRRMMLEVLTLGDFSGENLVRSVISSFGTEP